MLVRNPKKKPAPTTQDILSALPEYYQKVANQSFTFTQPGAYQNHRFHIRIRKKDLETKSPLYIWDTDSACFVSSLYHCPHNHRFVFDIGAGDTRQFWSIDTSFNIQQEEKGYYPNNSVLYEEIKNKLGVK